MRDAPAELRAAALQALLRVAAASLPNLAAHYRGRVPWLQGFLGHVDGTGAPGSRLIRQFACLEGALTASSGTLLVEDAGF